MNCYNYALEIEKSLQQSTFHAITKLKRLNRKSVTLTENGLLSRRKRLECQS